MTSFETESNAIANPFFNPNQEHYESLASILQAAIQRTYHQLMIMMETFPHMSNTEKKIKILAYACRTRQLFMRIYALVKFIKTAHINVSNILSFLDQQSFIFVNTADYLYHLANVKLVNARLPSFSILSSVDVLTLGTYPRLPSCIKDRILPSEKITDSEKEKTVKTLNRTIQCRLALSELPSQFKNFRIGNGFVDFEVHNEFEIKLTLISDNFNLPWRLLKINFLVKDARDPNKVLINNLQVNQIHQYLQEKLNENERPFVEIYKSLHFFVQALQLEVLFEQMSTLASLSRFYKIVKYEKCKMFTVEYWLDFTNKSFTFSVCVGENSDFLQTVHSPSLHWRDHKNIDLTFRSGELLIEKILHQIIKFRSKKRLMELVALFEQFSYCNATLFEDKPAIKVQFRISNFQSETFWINVDYYKGNFQVILANSVLNLKLKQSIEECLNYDSKKLDSLLLNLRVWLLLKRCQTIIRSYGFKCYDEIHIASFIDADLMNLYNKLEKNRFFVELKKQEKIFIMVTIKSREEFGHSREEINWHDNLDLLDDETSLTFSYYILSIGKCKYNGQLDSTKPFLKLLSLSHFKRTAQTSTLHQHKKLRRLAYDEQKDLAPIQQDNCLSDFITMINYIENFLPFLSLMKMFNKHNIITQNIQKSVNLCSILCLNLLSVPSFLPKEIKDFKKLDPISKNLWNSLVSLTIRQRQFKDYLNSGLPLQNQTFTLMFKHCQSNLTKFQFIMELTFNNNILINRSDKKMQVFSTCIEVNSLDNLYEMVKIEWMSICRMYSLIIECHSALEKYAELNQQLRIKQADFKTLVINYGPNFNYVIKFKWNKDSKMFDIFLDVEREHSYKASVDWPVINYHYLFINEIKKYFYSTKSVINLVQTLSNTCVTTFALAKLANVPKFTKEVSKLNKEEFNQRITPNCGFMLNIYSLNHFKLVYYSKYALDIHIKPNGLLSIRDDSFGLTDINSGNEDIHPIQFLSGFLKLFLDKSVEDLLRGRSSLVDDDNPASPTVYPVQPNQLNHVFLPPTSPAIQQPRTNQNILAPSPDYYGPSPGNSGPTSNAPIPQSPGFPNFGSPALQHSSPSTGHQMSSQSSMPIQSPSNFMSNSQPNFSTNSPATFSELSLHSPMVKSPFVGPSPSTNIPSIPPNLGYNKDFEDHRNQNPKSVPGYQQTTNQGMTLQTWSHQFKKCHSASIPNYLSEDGFLRMLSVNPETNYSPLEIFLASSHMKKVLIKSLNNDHSSFQLKSQDSNLYKTFLHEFQLINEIQSNYTAFSIKFIQTNPEFAVDIIHNYFNYRILTPPFKPASSVAFFNMLSISDPNMLRDFNKLLSKEMNPEVHKNWSIKFVWTTPNGYIIHKSKFKNQNQNLMQFYQTSHVGFQKRDKFYFFMLNLISKQRDQNSVGSLLLVISFEPNSNNFQYELLKPLSEANNQMYHNYDNQINANAAKPKDLVSVVDELLELGQLPNSLNRQR